MKPGDKVPSQLIERRELLDGPGIARALKRIAHEIVERHAGVPLAERLANVVAETGEAARPELGAIDITLYRDDVFEGLPKPEVGSTELPGHSIAGRSIVLVDDVLFTGRTIRAALDALMDYGRPRKVELAVLVDRGHRELPIQPDYVGITVQTRLSESVKVTLSELGAPDRVALREKVT